jgi:hypothetical protein
MTAVRFAVIVACCIHCSGCTYWGDPPPERIDLVVTQSSGGEISFDLPPDIPLSERESAAVLGGLSLTRASQVNGPSHFCLHEQEVFWAVQADARLKESAVIHWPFRYGDAIPRVVVTVSAKKLTPGRYRLCADVSLPKHHYNGAAFTTLIGEFEIDRDPRTVW